MWNVLKRALMLCLAAALFNGSDFDAAWGNEPPRPRIGVVQFPVASLDPADVESAGRIRLISSRNIGLSEKLSVIPIDVLDKFIADNEVSILKLYEPDEIGKIPVDFAQYLVTGFVSVEEKNYRVKIYLLDIEKKDFVFSEEALVDKKDEAAFWESLKNLTGAFLEKLDNTVLAQVIEEVEKPYRIGDTGPAGGLIFYVKSAYGDGWRYLEAAPPEAEFDAPWALELEGAILPNDFSTSGAIGAGRKNTANFAANTYVFPQKGSPRLAATGCRLLDFGGYTDWFLPSKDELMFMYSNLASRGLGGFRGDAYWSSTESSYEYAHFQSFREGKQFFNGYKLMPLAVRAVRAF
jgi:hypothetical protein